MDTNEHWVTVAVAAKTLGKSERTIRRWVADGKIPVDRTGPAILVDIAGLAPGHATTTPGAGGETERLRADLAKCAADRERLRADLAAVQADRDRLWTALDKEQVAVQAEQDNARALVDALASGQLLLGERAGERPRRRFRWPWQREG